MRFDTLIDDISGTRDQILMILVPIDAALVNFELIKFSIDAVVLELFKE